MGPQSKPDYAGLTFPPPPADRPYVLINMVVSADGKVALEGTERGLGSPTDQRLMRELRLHADVVLNGAGTLRASGASPRLQADDLEALRLTRGKTKAPLGAVLSRSGDLPLNRAFFRAPDFDAIVYLSDTAPVERRQAIAATGRTVQTVPASEEVAAMLRHMRQELGAQLLLVEGGPSLNGELFRRRAVDELFLTVGPVIVGGEAGLTPVEGPRLSTLADPLRLTLVAATPNPATDEVYIHYRCGS